jgi:hypothetical protein
MIYKSINWFALVGAIIILLLLPISYYFPWWQLIIGENLFQVNTSPVNTHFSFMAVQLNIPIIWAMNVTGLFIYIASGVTLLIYALMPKKTYSIDLLGFAYRKPLYSVLLYLVGLVVTTLLINSFVDLNIPVMGTSTVNLPQGLSMGVNVEVVVYSAFQWPFWLALAAAVICIIARIHHPRISRSTQQTTMS